MKTINYRNLSIIIIFSLLAVALLIPSTVLARGSSVKDTVNQGDVLDQNTVLYGSSVVMDGVVNGDLVAVGTDVKINGEVNGDLVVAGKNVLLNGPVTGNVYVSAVFLVVGPQASVERDVFFFGNSIATQAGSTINRDLNAIGLESELTGNVNRRVNALVGPVLLVQKVYDFLVSKGWWPKSLQIGPRSFRNEFEQQTRIGLAFGLASVHDAASISLPVRHNSIALAPASSQSLHPVSAIDVTRVRTWATSLLKTLVTLLILGLLIAWLVPRQLDLAETQARLKPWRALLTGLLVIVLGWLVAILVFIVVIALAVFFYWLTLPALGFFIGAFGVITIGLGLSLFWLSIAYLSKIVVAYLIGSLIFKRFIPSFAQNRLWPLVVGIILYSLLASIPYLGWLIAILSTLIGLGALWMLTSRRQLPEPERVEQPAPEESSQEISTVPQG
jgi:cytoskeletal protein CcmA (bactofilin family)